MHPQTWYSRRIDLHQLEQTLQILDVDPALLAARIAHFMDGSGRVIDVLLKKHGPSLPCGQRNSIRGRLMRPGQNEISERAVEIRQLTLGDARLPEEHTVGVS